MREIVVGEQLRVEEWLRISLGASEIKEIILPLALGMAWLQYKKEILEGGVYVEGHNPVRVLVDKDGDGHFFASYDDKPIRLSDINRCKDDIRKGLSKKREAAENEMREEEKSVEELLKK